MSGHWVRGMGGALLSLAVVSHAWAQQEPREASAGSGGATDVSSTLSEPDPPAWGAQDPAEAAFDISRQPLNVLDAEAAPEAQSSGMPAPFELKVVSSEGEALRLCERFLEAMIAGEHGRAFEVVRPHFPVSEERFVKLKAAISDQLDVAGQHLGRPLGFTFLSAERIGQLALRYRFAQQFPVDLFYWEFLFYRTPEGWIINQLGFDDDIEPLFRGS